jgi:hypothetical protein
MTRPGKHPVAGQVVNDVAVFIRPELTLLRIVARLELTPSEKTVLHDVLAAPLNWEYLVLSAGWHGLKPLLFHHLAQCDAAAVPSTILESLRADCREIALRNLAIATKLNEVSAHLRAQQIDHIVFKGPLLAESYYGNWALRVSHDIDLIVPPAMLVAASGALGDIGFRDKHRYSAAQQAASFRYGFEHSFSTAEGLDLDLHWRVVPRFSSHSLAMEGIWQRVMLTRFFDRELPTFCPADLLVALCLHAGQHEWLHISHFCDMAQVLRVHPDLDWDVVRSHLGDSNTTRIVSIGLLLLRKHWPVSLPADMKAMLSDDPHVARLADRIEQEVWPSPESAGTQSSLRWMLDRSAGVRLRDRARFLAGILLNPTLDDIEMFKLPRMLTPLYPGLRALRLGRKYSAAFWRA